MEYRVIWHKRANSWAEASTVVETPGIQYGRDVHIHEEKGKHLVLFVKGGMVYLNRADGSQYAPAEYVVLDVLEKHETEGVVTWKVRELITFNKKAS